MKVKENEKFFLEHFYRGMSSRPDYHIWHDLEGRFTPSFMVPPSLQDKEERKKDNWPSLGLACAGQGRYPSTYSGPEILCMER